MVEVQKEEEKKVRCFLVGAPDKKRGNPEPKELMGLVDTLGMEVSGILVLTRLEPTPAYGMGSGKAQEIVDRAKESESDCIVFDWEIDPSKQRNWEKLSLMPCFDRNEVILRIFASRARTKEAGLQVQLAKLTYSLPRLSHMYGDMARQRGGNYGGKGAGETQLELDRRQVEDEILKIRKELEQVVINRETQRKQREKTATPSCALVGYTNAGKSSLLNALTGADVFVENKLFATLDTTTRKLSLSETSSCLITDTVGFISNLPHTLVNAFKSTLEETALADLLLLTVDASDPECVFQYEQVLKVLKEIKADEVPRLVLLNKFDRIEGNILEVSRLRAAFPDAIAVSAKTSLGFEDVFEAVTENLLGSLEDYRFPYGRADLVELIRKNGTIEEEKWLDSVIEVKARVPGRIDSKGHASTRTLAMVMDYLVDAKFYEEEEF